MKNAGTKTLSRYALLVALALILSYIETLVPMFFAVPGMKLGLTNLVVLAAMVLLGAKSAFFINLVRIFLVALLFGNGVSLVYSLAGGMLSWIVMALLYRTGAFHITMVSIAGGIAHNCGQILAAMLVMRTTAVGWYLLILWFTGLASGAAIGLLSAQVCQKLQKAGWGK